VLPWGIINRINKGTTVPESKHPSRAAPAAPAPKAQLAKPAKLPASAAAVKPTAPVVKLLQSNHHTCIKAPLVKLLCRQPNPLPPNLLTFKQRAKMGIFLLKQIGSSNVKDANNCVLYLKNVEHIKLPSGLTTWSAKEKIINSHEPKKGSLL